MEDNNSSEILDAMLDGLPEDEKPVMRKMIAATLRVSNTISPQTELMRKVSSENISELLQLQKQENELIYKDSRNNRIVSIVAVSIVAIFAIVIIILLKDQPELLKEILIPLISLIVGAVGGYGFGKSRRDGSS